MTNHQVRLVLFNISHHSKWRNCTCLYSDLHNFIRNTQCLSAKIFLINTNFIETKKSNLFFHWNIKLNTSYSNSTCFNQSIIEYSSEKTHWIKEVKDLHQVKSKHKVTEHNRNTHTKRTNTTTLTINKNCIIKVETHRVISSNRVRIGIKRTVQNY
jgi:hypothetical protein